MALITVREKGAGEDAPTHLVDESWLKRWPDDFDVVEDAEGTAAHASVATITPVVTTPKREAAPEGETEGDPNATRGRF